MATLHELTTTQLKHALQLREQIESLQQKLDALLGGGEAATTTKKNVGSTKGRRTMSAATIEKMRAAQQARWAKIHGRTASKKSIPAKVPIKMVAKKKGGMTPEGKAKIAAAMKARWAAKKSAAEQV